MAPCGSEMLNRMLSITEAEVKAAECGSIVMRDARGGEHVSPLLYSK